MRFALVITLLLVAGPLSARETKLGYDAFVGGAKVGAAEVTIEKDTASYAISGSAWTIGVLNFVTRWQSIFSATGRLGEQGPTTDRYSLVERARDKVKELFLEDGHLTYVKNGHMRNPVAPSSLDLLSALFVTPGCAAAGSEVHNGKDLYAVKLTRRETLAASTDNGATERCEFEVSDSDNERINATIWLGQVDGITVPLRLDLAGALEGSLKLRT
jgi:Protein of unknown function (DUF3108)